MSNISNEKRGSCSATVFYTIATFVALLTALVVWIALHAPVGLRRGSALRCSEIRTGMPLQELKTALASKPSPSRVEYAGNKLYLENGSDMCIVYLDDNGDKVVRIEKSWPSIVY